MLGRSLDGVAGGAAALAAASRGGMRKLGMGCMFFVGAKIKRFFHSCFPACEKHDGAGVVGCFSAAPSGRRRGLGGASGGRILTRSLPRRLSLPPEL